MGSTERKEPWSLRKAHACIRRRNALGSTSPKPLERWIFVISCNHQGLKTGVLKVGGLGWDKALRTLPCFALPSLLHDLERRQAKSPGSDEGKTAILGILRTHSGEIIHSSCHVPERQLSGDASLGPRSQWAPFPSLTPQHTHRAACRKAAQPRTICLTCLYQVPHLCALE